MPTTTARTAERHRRSGRPAPKRKRKRACAGDDTEARLERHADTRRGALSEVVAWPSVPSPVAARAKRNARLRMGLRATPTPRRWRGGGGRRRRAGGGQAQVVTNSGDDAEQAVVKWVGPTVTSIWTGPPPEVGDLVAVAFDEGDERRTHVGQVRRSGAAVRGSSR
eukprot:SAG31_NODE_3298_length_4446_cov_24.869335_4_plen_166_part_00